MWPLVRGASFDDPLDPYRAVGRGRPDGRCWLMANMVGGLDGAATIEGRVGRLTNETDQRLFRALRSLADVVLVGAETVRRERYGPVRLTDEQKAERASAGRTPVPPLAIVSRSLDLDWSAPAFAAVQEGATTIVLTGGAADPERLARAAAVAEVVLVGDGVDVEPGALLDALTSLGARVVLCEGGPHLLGRFVAAGLLDELCLTIAPVLGGDGLGLSVAGPSACAAVPFGLESVLVDDEGALFLRYERAPAGAGR
ncbi:MAG: pyrimidine reductase family protein [Acidimicrobiia bacterium]